MRLRVPGPWQLQSGKTRQRTAEEMNPGSISKPLPADCSHLGLVSGPLLCLGLSPDTGTSHSVPFHCSLPGQVHLHSEDTDLYLDAVGPDELGLTQQPWLLHFKVWQGFTACERTSLALLLDMDYIIIFFFMKSWLGSLCRAGLSSNDDWQCYSHEFRNWIKMLLNGEEMWPM